MAKGEDNRAAALGCVAVIVVAGIAAYSCSSGSETTSAPEPAPTIAGSAPQNIPTRGRAPKPADAFAISPPAYIGPCMARDPGCESSRQQQPAEWQAAFDGNYQAQRNLAYTQSAGEFSGRNAVPAPIQGCAWRIVIMTTQTQRLQELDRTSLQSECGKLSAEDRQAATIVSQKIIDRIDRGLGPPRE